MTREADREAAARVLAVVSEALAGITSKDLLDGIGWSRDVEERFFADGASRLPEPSYRIPSDALETENATLSAVVRKLRGDDPVTKWGRHVVRGAIDRNRLLLATGTREFGKVSREIYGGASSRFFGLAVTNGDLAKHVLERLRVHGWDEARDESERQLSAEDLADELRRRIAKHRPTIELAVQIDDKLASKAIAGSTRVRVRAGATFAPWEADGLFCHEVETHAFTAQNGAAQAHATFLRAGGPRSTPTQEGLAVFAELYNRALAVPRLERLAMRVTMVGMAEDGASFLDLYRLLLERGWKPRDAYLDAARVCRGGLPEGGSAFTKDACYLAGVLHVYAFLSAFVRGGFRDEAEMLVAGRIALDDVEALVQLRAMGLLERPRHLPRWLRKWNTLLPYFAFASFLEKEIDLGEVHRHYAALIDRAKSARAPG